MPTNDVDGRVYADIVGGCFINIGGVDNNSDNIRQGWIKKAALPPIKVTDSRWNSCLMERKGHQEFPPESVIKNKPNLIAYLPTCYRPYFPTNVQEVQESIIKSIFWTNEKLSLMVAWSSSVSISCLKVISSMGLLFHI